MVVFCLVKQNSLCFNGAFVKILTVGQGGDVVFKGFFFIFSSGGHFAYKIGTICIILIV